MTPGAVGPSDPSPADRSDASTDGSAAPARSGPSVVRSEERVRLSTEAVPVERVRVAKVVVAREETVTVTVRREELRLVREPVLDGEPVPSVPVPPIELVLHEERIVVDLVVVPTERVRVDVLRVGEATDVTTVVRRERVDVGREDPPTDADPTLRR